MDSSRRDLREDRRRWTYLYRAPDQHGQIVDALVSQRRDAAAAPVSFGRALSRGRSPIEVTTDRTPVYPRAIDEPIFSRPINAPLQPVICRYQRDLTLIFATCLRVSAL
jgi:hypothetical protein